MKGFRAAVLLVARQARIKDQLPERDVKRLGYAYERTLDAYRRTVGRGDIELRALSGLRSALEALGAASRRPARTGWVTTAFADGSGLTQPVPIDLARTPEWAEANVLQLRWLGLVGLEVVEGEGG